MKWPKFVHCVFLGSKFFLTKNWMQKIESRNRMKKTNSCYKTSREIRRCALDARRPSAIRTPLVVFGASIFDLPLLQLSGGAKIIIVLGMQHMPKNDDV